MPNFSDALADDLINFAVDLNRYIDGEGWRQVRNELVSLERALVDRIREADLGSYLRESYRARRAERLIREAGEEVRLAYTRINSIHRKAALKVSSLQVDSMVSSTNRLARFNLLDNPLKYADYSAIQRGSLIEGQSLSKWWGKESRNLRFSFEAQLRQGLLAGEGTEDLVKRIRGTATGRTLRITTNKSSKKVREFSGGIFDGPKHNSRTLVRTSVHNLSNKALTDVFKKNENVVKGLEALVTLDSRTSQICMARVGAAWSLDGNPLPDSPTQEGFPGPPPWHFNCRTILLPIIIAFDELIATIKVPAKAQDSLKQLLDGIGSKQTSLSDWLSTKSQEFQKSKLGKGKWELWKAGKITQQQLIDTRGNPLTFKQLQELVEQSN